MYDLIIDGKLEGLYSCQRNHLGVITNVMFNYNPYWGITRNFKSIEEMTETLTKENLEELKGSK